MASTFNSLTPPVAASAPAIPAAAQAVLPAPRHGWRRHLRRHGLVFGAVLLALIVLAALAAPWLSSHDPYAQDIANRLVPPAWSDKGSVEHLLGTDKLGRDYFSRLLHGARISLLIGLSAAVLSGLIGTTLGVLAGYFGGRTDAVISYLITTRLALPAVLVALALSSLVGGSLTVVIVLLGCLLWDRFAVVTRSVTQRLREAEYIASAKALGASTPYILVREILPNMVGTLTVVVTLEMAHAILLEATLSFLGLGVQAPMPSWGLMIAEGKAYMYFQPWVLMIPGACLAVLVLAINLVGDGLRDINARDGRI